MTATCHRHGCHRQATTRGWCEPDYRRQVRMRLTGYVDPTPVLHHLRRLRALGWTWEQIGATAHISHSVPYDLAQHRYQRLQKVSADALLAVPLTSRESHRGVGAHGTKRRVQALAWMGWPEAEVAARCGVRPKTIAAEIDRGRVSHRLALRVAAVYADLSHVPGPSQVAAGKARSLGHPPPAAWDEDTIDNPRARPIGARRTA